MYKKILSLFLICVMVLSLAGINLPALKADAATYKTSFIDFSDSEVSSLVTRTTTAAEISYTDEVAYKNTNGSLKFEVLTSSKNAESRKFSFAQNNIVTNWNYVSDITFTIYNQTAGTDVLNIVFSKTSDTINNGYYRCSILLDWTGWKKITIQTSDFKAAKGITSWEEIDTMYFNMAGWSGQSTKGTCFYVSSVEGIYDYDLMSTECLTNMLAMYSGNKTAIYNNNEETLQNSPTIKSGIMYVPLSALTGKLNFSYSDNLLSRSGVSAGFGSSSAKVTIGAYEYTLCAETFTRNSDIYVPVKDICNIFDLCFTQYERLCVIGSEEDIYSVDMHTKYGINLYAEKIIQKLCTANDSTPSDSDCEKIIDKWILAIAGSEEINSSSDETVARKVRNINNNANTSWGKLIKTEGSAELFSDITSTSTAAMTSASLHIYQMALGYGTYGGANYKNEELKEDILYALEWFCENRYGEDEANNNENAWRDTSLYNWWDWRIGTPQNLVPALMIMRDDISAEDMERYLVCFNAIVPAPTSTGSNYINMSRLIIGAAALLGDTAKIEETANGALSTFEYVDNGRNPESKLDSARAQYTPNRGQGFYKDGSYVYHTLHAMNGSYGLSHLNTASDLVSLLSGTSFELPSYCADVIADWILNSFDTLMYKNSFPRMVVGRNEDPSGLTQSRTIVKAAVRCFDMFDENDKELVGSVIKEYSSHYSDNFIYNVDICNISDIREILASDKYNSYRFDNSTVFANMDKAMHKRSGWALGISMSSSRIFNYESINGVNKDGWYLGDGRYEIVIDSEGTASRESYWKYIDPYRMPGTTVDTQTRQEVSIAQGNEYLSSKDFVGGAVLDGKYLTAAMHLESYHNSSEQGDDNDSYGSSAPVHKNDLAAKKSYFAFDNEIYCLGAEVKASDNNNAEVLTIIDNRILSDKVTSDLGDVELSSEDTSFSDVTWLNADNKIGYYFPDESKSQLYLRKTDNTNTYFESVFNHGANPESASYAYAILPGMTADQTEAYANSPAVEILSNTEDIQAVRNPELGITSIVFWTPGTFEGITVDKAMVVMIKEDGNNLEISVSDPTQKLESAKITFSSPFVLSGGSKNITQAEIDSEYAINSDFSKSLGQSFEAVLVCGDPVGLKLDLYSESGEKLNPYSAHLEEKIIAGISAANLSSVPEDMMLVVAMYSTDGTLQDVKMQNVTVLSGQLANYENVELAPDSQTSLIKGFVWNQGSLKPFDMVNIK